MIHFIYLLVFSLGIAVVFGLISPGTQKEKLIAGAKSFAQFLFISLAMAWVFYFIPW